MRATKQGAFVKVTVSYSEVHRFKQSWPCSNLPDCRVGFLFDVSNGDLVDAWPEALLEAGEAAAALSHDANNYAAKQIKQFYKLEKENERKRYS